MANTAINFRYLDESDMIAAGVTDIRRCVNVMEETLELLHSGDFRMSGPDAFSHGAMINFPDHPEHEGMPANGPDRRFMAMPAYLGGRFRTTGVKWYGSNTENRSRGLPRSIHLMMLNDTDTGAPLAVMSANLISAYRTGAVPGVAAKRLARADAEVLGVVGPGVIGRAVAEAVLAVRPGIRHVVAKGIDDADVQRFADYLRPKYPQLETIESVGSVEEVIRPADVATVTMTTSQEGSSAFPYIAREWIKPGALLLHPAAVRHDEETTISPQVRKVVDSRRLYDAWAEELGTDAYQQLGIVGTHWHDLMRAGKIPSEHFEEISDIAAGRSIGRHSDDEIFLYSAGGMPVEDVAWATDVLHNAQDRDLGTSLPLWENPALS